MLYLCTFNRRKEFEFTECEEIYSPLKTFVHNKDTFCIVFKPHATFANKKRIENQFVTFLPHVYSTMEETINHMDTKRKYSFISNIFSFKKDNQHS